MSSEVGAEEIPSRDFVEKFCRDSDVSPLLVDEYVDYICKNPPKVRYYLINNFMLFREESK